ADAEPPGRRAMCGLVVAGDLGRPIEVAALQRMNDLQAHRGPDGEGFLLGWVTGGRFSHTFLSHTTQRDTDTRVTVGLAHRRLAIIDLSDRGLQPMTVEESYQWIVVNGELYNHRELRAQLETRGYRFTTRT